jgi:hypothetical protein
VRAVAVARVLAGEQQQVVALGADLVLEPDQHLVEERVLQVRVALARLEEDPDDVRALRDEAARGRRRRVVELPRQAHDPFACLRADVGVAVERARHGSDRDPAQVGQLPDGHSVAVHRA